MSDLGGYVSISYSNSYYFTNACNNDMLIYPETSNQKIHIGITSNSQSIFSINSNNMNITCSALDIASTINMRSNVTILGQLTVCNVEYITSNIIIYNSEIVQSNLSVFNIATLCNAVNIYGAATVSNTLNVTGLTSLCNVNVSSLATLSNGLTVYNNGTTVLSNAVNIYGATTISNNMQITSSLSIGSNIITTGSSNRIWDFSGTIADGYGKPGYVLKSYITGSNITVSTLTPFSNLNTEGSIYFQGIVGNYITVVPKPVSAALSDTTVETWIYQTANPAVGFLNRPYLIGNISTLNSGNAWSFGVNPLNQVAFYAYIGNVAIDLTSSSTITNNTWNHIAFTYVSASKTVSVFLNGIIQTLTASSGMTGSTAINFTTGAINDTSVPILMGQYNNVALGNTYISNFRYTNTALYTSSFTPSTYSLQTYSNSTQLLLRAPLYNPIVHLNAMHTRDSMRTHCLPTDAMIYADCYGTNQPNLSGSYVPAFDSNITKSIVFTRANSNYLSFPPQTFNIATKGFTVITKAMFTGSVGAGERMFDFGNGPGDNNILLARYGTNNIFYLGMGSNNGASQTFLPPAVLNQNTIFTAVARYDPFTNGGTATIWYNGSNIYSSNSMAAGPIGFDRTVTNIYVGRSEWGGGDLYLSGNVYNFAVYNRALTDKEITDASAALMVEPSLPNKSTVEFGNATGKPSLTVQQDGTIQIAGPITTNNNLSYSPVDYGVSNFSIPGSIVGTVPAVAMSPFNTTTEGSMFVRGASSNYVSIPNSIFNTKWTNGFTCEAWVNYPTFSNVSTNSWTGIPTTLGVSNTINADWLFGVNNQYNPMLGISQSSAAFAFYNTSSGWNYSSTSYLMQTNTWYHIAVTYDGSFIRIFVNGILQISKALSGSGVPRNSISNFLIGGPTSDLGTGGGVANMYITNVRVVYGSALYTASFTPPTGQLGPAATGTTALLLRSIQNPGRVLISKIGGTTQVQAYPPVTLTGNLTNVQNTSYGTGSYIITSSTSGDIAYRGFSQTYNGASYWQSERYTGYNSVSPYNYIGSNTTVDISGNFYAGEWLQVKLPQAITLNSYYLAGGGNSLPGPTNFSTPSNMCILGSKDGLNWQLVNKPSYSSIYTQTTNMNIAYSYYRAVISNISGYFAGYGTCINQFILYGTEESISITPDGQVGLGVSSPVQALEVAGNAIINGNISANNIGVFRNRIINGDMMINQRGVASSNIIQTGGICTVDRFSTYLYGTGSYTISNIPLTSSDTPYQYGFRNSFRAIAGTVTISSVGTAITQVIEGNNCADFNWGTSYGSPITISFWLRTNLSANSIISGALNNYWAGTAVYAYTLSTVGSNVWQYYSTTIPPPPTGTTWGTGINGSIIVSLGAYIPGSTIGPNIWTAGPNMYGSSNATNWTATSGNFIEFTGVQLEKGTIATPFEFRPLAIELQLCQRYFFQLSGSNYQVLATTFPSNNTNTADAYIPTRVTMRTTPNVLTTSAMSTFNIGPATALSSFTLGSDSTSEIIRLMQTGTFTNNIYASGVYLRAAFAQTAYLGFSAEL